MPPNETAALPKEYKRVKSVDDLRGLSGHNMAFHPEFARHFIDSLEMYCVDGKFLTYFDLEVEEWLVAPSYSVFGLPKDLSFIDQLIPGSNFSTDAEIPGLIPKEGLAYHHWLEEDVLTHLSKTLRSKRVKPLRAYHEKCALEVTVRPGHIDISRWDDYLGWSRGMFEDSWLVDFSGAFRSFFASSPLAMPLSFYVKDRLIGVYIGGTLPHQYEMFTHVCDPEFAHYSKFMIMSALDFGVKNYKRAYTLPDFYEDEEMMQKDWKTLWKLPNRAYYCYGDLLEPVLAEPASPSLELSK
ncbi:MAG: hypothetical protein COV48_15080 [Elusimicrobia bacterium CG11_big_fil_rev_8_21_14_0_20_64_6]|nr:MAG: hypothetical protein COV48_15080 [Elusimicrobia bacterium CG11_big_fil_rev_8_21_14_0_20_64_6]